MINLKDEDESIESQLDKASITEGKGIFGKLKSYFSRHKKESEVVTLNQVEQLLESKLKQHEKTKPEEEKEDITDPKKVLKYFDKVCNKKYGVSPVHMIQKTAMHYLIETGGVPISDSVYDRASRAAETVDKTFSAIDRIEGEKTVDIAYMKNLVEEIEVGINLTNKIKQLEPKKELTPQDIMTHVNTAIKTINMLKSAKLKAETLEVQDLGTDSVPFKE